MSGAADGDEAAPEVGVAVLGMLTDGVDDMAFHYAVFGQFF